MQALFNVETCVHQHCWIRGLHFSACLQPILRPLSDVEFQFRRIHISRKSELQFTPTCAGDDYYILSEFLVLCSALRHGDGLGGNSAIVDQGRWSHRRPEICGPARGQSCWRDRPPHPHPHPLAAGDPLPRAAPAARRLAVATRPRARRPAPGTPCTTSGTRRGTATRSLAGTLPGRAPRPPALPSHAGRAPPDLGARRDRAAAGPPLLYAESTAHQAAPTARHTAVATCPRTRRPAPALPICLSEQQSPQSVKVYNNSARCNQVM